MKSQQRRTEHRAIDRILARIRRDGELIQSAPPQEGGSLEEIALRIGKEPRTLRSWMGAPYWLLPGAERSGRGVQYSAEFERRARLIARLLDVHGLGLSEVSGQLARRTDDEISAFLQVKRLPNDEPQESAAEYAARVRKANEEKRGSGRLDWNAGGWGDPGQVAKGWGDPGQVAKSTTQAEWETHYVQEGIEISIRKPIEERLRKKLGRILAEARRILREP